MLCGELVAPIDYSKHRSENGGLAEVFCDGPAYVPARRLMDCIVHFIDTRLLVNASTSKRDNGDVPFTNKPDTRLQVNEDAFKKGRNIESTKKPNIETKEESIADNPATQPLAPDVAPSPASQSSLSVSSQAVSSQEESFHVAKPTTPDPMEPMTTGNAPHAEQKSLMPDLPPKVSSKKKQRDTEPLVPREPPKMPPDDMAWGTKKCLHLFDAWRGHILIGHYKLTQASTCAKGLAEQYTEEEVRKVYQSMGEDEYWKEKGLDICNVANNIHKEIKKVRSWQNKPASQPVEAGARPSFLVSEEQKQKNLDKLRALAAAKTAKE